MAQGKFSKPRGRFQSPRNSSGRIPTPSGDSFDLWDSFPEEDPAPAEPINDESLFPSEESGMPSFSRPKAPLLPEEEAMDHAFTEVTGANRDESDTPDSFFLRNRKILLVSVCAFALVVILGIIGFVAISSAADPYNGKILNNVLIGDIPVGGLTRSQAEAAVRKATEGTFTGQDMVVQLADTALRFSPADTKAKLDVTAVVKAAYQYGRTGTQEERQAAYHASLTGNHTVAMLPYLRLDQEYIQLQLREFAAGIGSTYTPASYRLEGERPDLQSIDPDAPGQTLYITLGTPGLGLDVDQLYNDILDAYSFNRFLVERRNLSPSVTPDPPDLQAIYAECCVEPVSATMNFQTYEPIPGSYGYGFDLEQAQQKVDQANFGETISIPLSYIEPETQADELLFRDVLGSCETPHGANEKRTTNLRLVCQILNGVVINPGEEFSYNDAVGERTVERGFQAAPAYSGTELINSVGGGVCQGSSTLYYCALLADMEVTERINHGFPSSYIDMGMDATVNWGGPDLKFRNNGNYPVKIEAEVSDGYMRMRLLGTEERDYYVKMEYEIARYITPEVVYREYGPDSGYKDGKVLDNGCTGYLVRTYKCKYSLKTNELISREFEALSSYMTKDKIVVRIVDNTPSDPTEPEKPTDPPAPTDPEKPTDPPAPTEPEKPTDPPSGGGESGGESE
ncbi:MAG: VanW family protein [Faecousia sp.]